MSEIKDKYGLGVGKTVLQLFKKLLEKKSELQTGGSQQSDMQQPEVQQPEVQQPDMQQPDMQQPEVQQPDMQQPEVQQPEVQQPEVQQETVSQNVNDVILTKVEQYYDGTIFEGIIEGDDYDIQFNIKDRTKKLI